MAAAPGAADEASEVLDCVIPAHEKDFETLGRTVASIRRCCPEVRRILVVSREPWDGAEAAGVEHLDEAADLWPFGLSDLEGCGCPPGWLLQQLLKLHAPLLVPGLAPNVLVCDADVVWLAAADGGVRFLEARGAGEPAAARLCVFDTEGCPPIRSAVDLHRYDAFVPAVLPGLEKPRPREETAVCHHACLQRAVVADLAARVEEAHGGRPFWQVFRDAGAACGGRASEYELYHAFARRFWPARVVSRRLPFAVVSDAEAAARAPAQDVAFLVAHSHLRGLSPAELRDREGVINGDVRAEVVRRLTHDQPPELAAILAGSGMF